LISSIDRRVCIPDPISIADFQTKALGKLETLAGRDVHPSPSPRWDTPKPVHRRIDLVDQHHPGVSNGKTHAVGFIDVH
jgi:hypothetical protein